MSLPIFPQFVMEVKTVAILSIHVKLEREIVQMTRDVLE